jgi:lipopolysaccharide/colanic/teichoic acid biosynthesis glycosyltransferase
MKKRGVYMIRAFDICLAIVLLPFALCVFALLVIPQLVCFGKIFYASRRSGKNNEPFTHVKLKSMRDDEAARGGGRAHLETNRIPAWGRFVRKTHFDEIPELLLILAGTESFVGPRPLLPKHAALVDTAERRAAKPGWTGLPQIFLKRRGILPSRIQRRLDLRMSRDMGPLLYMQILFATLPFRRSKRKSLRPGPTVSAYRKSLEGENNENP